VIITRDKEERPAHRHALVAQPSSVPVDHSVFTEGQGLLDMGAPANSGMQENTPSHLDKVMTRLSEEQKHEDAVNEVMEEIEDQLDSDEDDHDYMITKNSSTGGNELISTTPITTATQPDFGLKQDKDLEQYASTDYY